MASSIRINKATKQIEIARTSIIRSANAKGLISVSLLALGLGACSTVSLEQSATESETGSSIVEQRSPAPESTVVETDPQTTQDSSTLVVNDPQEPVSSEPKATPNNIVTTSNAVPAAEPNLDDTGTESEQPIANASPEQVTEQQEVNERQVVKAKPVDSKIAQVATSDSKPTEGRAADPQPTEKSLAVTIAQEPKADKSEQAPVAMKNIPSASESSDQERIAEINKLTSAEPSAAGVPFINDIKSAKGKARFNAIQNDPLLATDASVTDLSWSLSRVSGGPGGCQLSTPTVQMDGSEYASQLWFGVIEDVLMVNATTSINIDQRGVGLSFDGEPVQAFDQSLFAYNALWAGDLASLADKKSMRVIIGGGDIGSERLQIKINLKGFSKAYERYQRCRDGGS